jgi:23S rRNA pseudouridine2605 synthase
MHPRHGSTKEYVVEVVGQPGPATLARLRAPLALAPDEWTTGAEVRLEDVAPGKPGRSLLRVVLHEGRNRQIRRMLDQVGHPVLRLVRVRVGAVSLGRLRPGEWRHLGHDEIASFFGAPLAAAPAGPDAALTGRRA